MGTNYYLKKPACAACGRKSGEWLHIGKSSAGWMFALHVYRDPSDISDLELIDKVIGVIHDDETRSVTIMTLADWRLLIHAYGVVDEYGKDILPSEMMDIITDRERWRTQSGRLSHHTIDHYHCIANRSTYDLCVGEFS